MTLPSASYDPSAMTVDSHAIAYHSELFSRDSGKGADLLWLLPGSGYIDLGAATAHGLEHDSPWEYRVIPQKGSLRKENGYYRAYIHNGANLFETIAEIPAYYID